MDPRTSMTGETSKQNPPSVFGFDPYPPPYGVNWNQTNPFANPSTLLQQQLCCPNQVPFSSLPAFNPANVDHSMLSQSASVGSSLQPFEMPSFPDPQPNYSFGTPKPTQEVVQFPFQIMTTSMSLGYREVRCKRKTDSPPLPPVKQHITEEKMAEHMSKLHISSETPNLAETETTKMRRLYLCEEMRKLQTDSILPQSLIAKIERPCTALVLWKPPARLLPPLGDDRDVVDENENNNAEGVPDSNVMDMAESGGNYMDMDN